MTNLKWADVAHYYTMSDIEMMFKSGNKFSRFAMDYRESLFETPILRHLDDLTEEHARELHEIWIGEFEPSEEWPTCLKWMTTDGLQDSFTMNALNIFKGEPDIWHYLISKGYDLFDLIENSEAIRKPLIP